MPVYEYQCSDCDHTVDIFQKSGEADTTRCPACGKSALRRLISAGSFVLKGGGWYVTDFRDKKSGKAEGKESGRSAQAGSESKSDADTGKSGGDAAANKAADAEPAAASPPAKKSKTQSRP